MNYRHLVLAILLFTPLIAPAAEAQSRILETVEIGMRPESVTRGFDGDLFVTVMNDQVRGDGVIVRVRRGKVMVHTTGLDEPKGIAFVGEHLICTDLTRVWKIDAFGRKSLLADKSNFPHPVLYLNDVAAAPDGESVYVTDMGDRDDMWESPGVFWSMDSPRAAAMKRVGRVYRIDLSGKVTLVAGPSEDMICPNGVGIGKDGQVMIGGFFTGNILEVRDGELVVVATGYRGADAVEQDSSGRYYVSSWNQGKVWRFSPEGSPEVLVEGLQSAADFLLEEADGKLYLPDMKAGTLVVINIKE